MRIDKYLWCIRLFKTRVLATEQVRGEKIVLNTIVAKASKDVKPGDHLVLKRHGYNQEFTVLAIPKARLGAKLVPDYATEITPQTEIEKRDFLALAKNNSRLRGTGRPTKKDRRDLDDFDF